jgi:hypothetical protein
MPSAIDDTDTLEHTISTYDNHAARTLPLLQPSSRRARPAFLAFFRSCGTALRSLRRSRLSHCVSRTSQPELPMDMVARNYPNVYLRLTSWSV